LRDVCGDAFAGAKRLSAETTAANFMMELFHKSPSLSYSSAHARRP